MAVDRDRVVHRKELTLKFLIKAVHYRHRDDQHRKPHADAQERKQRRKRNKGLRAVESEIFE